MITVTAPRDTTPVYVVTDIPAQPTQPDQPIRLTTKGRRVRKIAVRTALSLFALMVFFTTLGAITDAHKAKVAQPVTQSAHVAVESSSCAGVTIDNMPDDQVQSLLDDGWTGDKADHREELYPRGCVPGVPVSTPLGSISCADIDLDHLTTEQVNSLKDAGWKMDYEVDPTGYTMKPGKCAPYPYN